jgi:hypothetical protein
MRKEGTVMEQPLDEIPEEGQEGPSVAPSSSPAGSAARKTAGCLLVTVGALVIACALVAIGVFTVGKDVIDPPPTPTPEPVRRVTPLDIRELAKLESVEFYLVAEISQVQVPDSWIRDLGLKEEIFILEYGTVVGGFDLTNLSDDAVWQDGRQIMLKLPSPEVLRVEIDHDKSHVVYRKGWCPEAVCGDDLDTFIQQIEPEAVKQLKEQAVEYGLLQKTAVAGRDYFYHFLQSLGFTEVRVVVDGYIYE